MRKTKILAALTGLISSLPFVADAAYPVYNPQQLARQGYVINSYQPQLTSPNANITSQQLAAASASNGQPVMYNVAATNPNRVTGTLPRVGSSATNAGRQYYQPADYDRLADSGLYIGVSAAYSMMISGSMSADYANKTNAFFAPGSFRKSDFNSDTVIPFQISVGAAINSDIRVDFSFLRYSGLSYADRVQTSQGNGEYADATVSGGAITSNSTMLNVYYNIDSFTGYMAGGSLRPYIGAGVGIALNTIADYVVFDNTFYDETEGLGPGSIGAGGLTAISDVYAYHNGGTSEQLAFTLEGGVTTDMHDGLKLDFFVRYAYLGKVKTSGSIVVSQTEWLSDGAGDEYEAPYDSVFHYTNWTESGRLSSLDIGARVRLEF
jgi:opacity protein-like surface antigen